MGTLSLFAYSNLAYNLEKGLDWHGSSAQDVWASVNALSVILKNNNYWNFWLLDVDSPVVVMGHSNGGQGAWYLASRYPDRVLGGLYSLVFLRYCITRSWWHSDPRGRIHQVTGICPADNVSVCVSKIWLLWWLLIRQDLRISLILRYALFSSRH